jgi:beta-xylosidase
MRLRPIRMLNVALVAALSLLPVSAASGLAQAGPRPCPGTPGPDVPLRDLGAERPHLILDENFPDPFIARFRGAYHAYATGNQVGGGQMNVQHLHSRSLTRWGTPGEALPADRLPAWVDRKHPQVWAPEVTRVRGRYILYFNARHASLTRTETPPTGPVVRQRHCLGAAVAARPEGPFTGVDQPLVCAEFPNGVIDANVYREGDRLYLYYKDDSNCCGPGSAIYAQPLSADGLATAGPARKLLANNDSPGKEDDWEWEIVEAPTMLKRGGAYYLFYSGNFFGNKNYSGAYLRCTSPLGPCTDLGDNPILWSHKETTLIGPGHQSLLERRGRSYIFFHGWNEDPDAKEQAGVHKRCLYVGQVRWERSPAGDVRPVIAGGEPAALE